MANSLPARLRRNYLQQAADRASLHEQRSRTLSMEKLHLELSLQAALAKIREYEGIVELQKEIIEGRRRREASLHITEPERLKPSTELEKLSESREC